MEQQPLSPEQLALRCKTGCRDSFDLIVEQFEPRILNFLCRMVGNLHDAEDLTQETFLRAYQGLHRYEPGCSFSTWLFTIAKRAAYNHYRATKPCPAAALADPIDYDDPAILLERKDTGLSVWRVAKALKKNQYEALWLRYGEGFSIAQTARIMRLNQIRVRVLLHRARCLLAKRLGRHKNLSLER